jgi:hypothetical protein
MHNDHRWLLPQSAQAKVTSAYWNHKPSRREAILKEVQRADARIDREKNRVVGYCRYFEYLFKIEMDIVILCPTCFKDKTPSRERKEWTTITKGQYYDQELCAVYLCYCDECEKRLIEKEGS